ncbi:MAG TPA: SprT-like domain-containing protein [Pyrinomonadaceae bacterium]|jgi:hypothetical protein
MFKPISTIIHFTGIALRALPLLFILSNPSPLLAPFSVEAPVSVEEFERDNNLQAESDALLSLFDAMPPVPVYLKDEPMLKTGTNTETGAAYTHCYGHERPTIFVKKIFYQKANRKQLVNLLKHEMTHAWLCRQRLMSGHDENFRRKFKQIGGFGN